MRRLLGAASTVVAGVLAAAVVLVAPATAGTIRMHDAVGDDATGHGHGDIKWMQVHYGADRLRITMKFPRSGDMAFFQDMYVDTQPKNPGPEVSIGTNGDFEGWGVSLVDGWGIPHGKERCSGAAGSADFDLAHHRIRFSVPRTCLMPRGAAQPPRIRMALATRSETDRTYDWLPARKTFGRWVHWK
jgi:hypothetical protein